MKTLLLAFAFFFTAGTLLAQKGSVQGQVVNEAGSVMPGADAYIETLGIGTSTDRLGRFIISSVPDGEYDLQVTFLGYERYRQKIVVKANETTHVKVTLAPGSLKLGDVVITGSLDREINSISQVDIQLRPTQTSQDILRMVPGLFIAQHAGGGKAEQIFLRGFDIDHGTDINLEVDGMPVNMVSHAHGQGPANENNSVVARGYTLLDAVLKYSRRRYEVSITAENLTNRTWNEAQFDTESKLFDETEPASEIHFTPGTPLFIKAGISFIF